MQTSIHGSGKNNRKIEIPSVWKDYTLLIEVNEMLAYTGLKIETNVEYILSR